MSPTVQVKILLLMNISYVFKDKLLTSTYSPVLTTKAVKDATEQRILKEAHVREHTHTHTVFSPNDFCKAVITLMDTVDWYLCCIIIISRLRGTLSHHNATLGGQTDSIHCSSMYQNQCLITPYRTTSIKLIGTFITHGVCLYSVFYWHILQNEVFENNCIW